MSNGNPQLYLLWQAQDKKCAYCKRKTRRKNATIDHVVPTARGGKNRFENKVVACRTCNQAKGDMLLTEWVQNIVNVAENRLALLGVLV